MGRNGCACIAHVLGAPKPFAEAPPHRWRHSGRRWCQPLPPSLVGVPSSLRVLVLLRDLVLVLLLDLVLDLDLVLVLLRDLAGPSRRRRARGPAAVATAVIMRCIYYYIIRVK